jgi:hypothetical protein
VAAFKYWRVKFGTSTGGAGSDIWLDDVSFLTAQMDDTKAGGSALSSSQFSGSYPLDQAFDGLTITTGWASAVGQFPAWIGYNFAQVVDVAMVKITLPADAGASDELPVFATMAVENSSDAISWADAGALTLSGTIGLGTVVYLLLPGATLPTPGVHGFLSVIGVTPYAPPEALDALGVRSKGFLSVIGQGPSIYFGGKGRVSGTVKNTPNSPVHRRVVLLDEPTRTLIRETWSDAITGAYTFDGIAMGSTYTVVSYDHTQAFRAVVADRVVPELMLEYTP